jgi:hypothetical protein
VLGEGRLIRSRACGEPDRFAVKELQAASSEPRSRCRGHRAKPFEPMSTFGAKRAIFRLKKCKLPLSTIRKQAAFQADDEGSIPFTRSKLSSLIGVSEGPDDDSTRSPRPRSPFALWRRS